MDLSAAGRKWVADYADLMLESEQLVELVEQMNSAIRTEIPEVADDAAFRRDLNASTLEAIRVYMFQLSRDPSPRIRIPKVSENLFRSLAQLGNQAELILRIFASAQRVAWRTVMADVLAASVDTAVRHEVLDYLWEQISGTIEEWAQQAVAAFLDESRARLSGATARRQETVHAILRGERTDVEAATIMLSHNLHRRQTGLVLWAADDVDPADAMTAMDALLREIAAVVKTSRPLAIPSGPRALWAWLSGPSASQLRNSLPGIDSLGNDGVQLAVGVPAEGLAGFRSSHTEAMLAQKLAMESGSGRAVTYYDDVEVVSLVSGSPDVMRTFVSREVGALAGADVSITRLRDTVLAYLRTGSGSRAAEELGIHKNTVLYRLQQAEKLIGHPVDQRKLQLEIALRVLEVYGPSV